MSKEKYMELVSEINELDFHYFTLDKPLVSDREYDEKYNSLVKMEEDNPNWIVSHSPTQRVGGNTLTKMDKKEHTYPLMSLDKAQDIVRVYKFFKDIRKTLGKDANFTLEWKFDGLAFVARYENGYFVEARTRGNGRIGELITEQARTIRNLPLEINYKGTVEVQGEIVIPLIDFKKYNERMNKKLLEVSRKNPDFELRRNYYENKYRVFNNPRNAASGAIRQLDLKETSKRPLAAYLYNVGHIKDGPVHMPKMENQIDMINFLVENKFKVSPLLEQHSDLNTLEKRIAELSKERAHLNFEVDGLVIKVNNIDDRKVIGHTSKFPKWAIAYKFESVEEITRIIDVEWEIGRTGRITPVAILEPVDFGGVVVNRATLNNLDDIKTKKLSIGADIFLRRSNDVIPEIMGVVPGSELKNIGKEDIAPPSHCPSCGSETVVELPFLWCRNTEQCPSQNIKKWQHFCSRDAMNIDGLSEKTLLSLAKAGKVKKISDLYYLKEDDFYGIDRFGPKRISNLLESVQRSKNGEWDRFLYSLGIQMVGRGTSERIAKVYPDYESLKGASYEDLIKIDDIGDKVSREIVNYFKNERNQKEVERLLAAGITFKSVSKSQTDLMNPDYHRYAGKNFVLTGKMSSPRRDVKEKIEKMGGKVQSAVNKRTNYLIYGESAGSKYKRAIELGVKTIKEEDFEF